MCCGVGGTPSNSLRTGWPMSARSENSNTNLAGFLFFFLGGILNTLQALSCDGGRGNGESCGGGQRASLPY